MNCSNRSVLIIDDNRKSREILKHSLKLEDDFFIYLAQTAEEILTALKKEDFRLIFMNYEMADWKKAEFMKIIEEQYYPPWKVWLRNIFNQGAIFLEKIMLLGLLKIKKTCFN